MQTFAAAFFKHFGAQIQTRGNEWVVDLPPHLAAVFDQPRLYLVFPGSQGAPTDLSPHEDLMVYGSRIFDRMMSLLAGQGECTAVRLPGRAAVTFGGDPPLPLHNCQRLEQQISVGDDTFYVFNFRVILLSDEKQEMVINLALDAAGQPHPEIVALLNDPNHQAFIADPAPAIEPEQLQRRFTQAETLARQRIAAQSAPLEAATKARLQENLLRLTSYYRRLRDEVNTDDPAQAETVKADLQQDLQRQIAEEVERHRLQVTLSPISYALVTFPSAHCHLTLATRHSQQAVTVSQNLYTGLVEPLICHHCRQPLDQLALCDHVHPVHPHCLDTCHICQLEVCQTCGMQACAICQRPVCRDCMAACTHCNRWLGTNHVQNCPICGLAFCPDDAFSCHRCGQSYCLNCGQKGTCATCQMALAGPLVQPAAIPQAAGLKIQRYRWQQAANKVYVIYLGQHFWWGKVVIVADKSGRVLYQQKTGWLSRFR